jgi:hypothetical protein
MNHRLFRLVALLGVCTLVLAACEVTDPLEDVELRLRVEGALVELGATAGRIAVAGGTSTVSSSIVGNDLDITSVEVLEQMRILPDYFGYVPAPGKQSAAQASGTVELYLFLGEVPVPGAPVVVTITDDVVTGVAPTTITVSESTIDRDAIEAALGSLPPAQQPDLAAWGAMTIDEVVGEINDALVQSSFPLVLVAVTTGDLSGDLKLNTFDLDAEVIK